jgi:hypothetical protein
MKLGSVISLFLTAFLAWTPGFAHAADSNVTFEAASVKPAGPFVPERWAACAAAPEAATRAG